MRPFCPPSPVERLGQGGAEALRDCGETPAHPGRVDHPVGCADLAAHEGAEVLIEVLRDVGVNGIARDEETLGPKGRQPEDRGHGDDDEDLAEEGAAAPQSPSGGRFSQVRATRCAFGP